MIFAAALLLSSADPVAVSQTRIEALVSEPVARTGEEEPSVNPDLQCTSDQSWCLQLSHDPTTESFSLDIFDGRARSNEPLQPLSKWTYPMGDASQSAGFDRSGFALWPQIIREPAMDAARAEHLTIGLLATSTAMYSGGGGHGERLTLYRIDASSHGKPYLQEVLQVPLSANVLIRACFSEKDYEERRGVCHDEYSFDAKLSLDIKAKRTSPPQLIYQTTAVATPGYSRRSEDNLEKGRLSDEALKPRQDQQCSYRRIIAYNPVTARYEFDRPGPECSDYTTP